jgi:glutamate 5-kinase
MNLRYKRITVKVGSNVLTREDGSLNVSRIAHLVDQIAWLHKQGVEVILVSSGAVAAGKAVMTPSKKTDAVSAKQLWAALGQVKLMNRYSDFFHEHGLVCAQILLTKENFSSRNHYLNMKNCLGTILENKVIPIINENDTISVTELMFTDNDELSGLITAMANSDALIILTNVDGVYNTHPGDENARLYLEINSEDIQPEDIINTKVSGFGRGGMATKFRIARKVAGDGIDVHVANGLQDKILLDLLDTSKVVRHTHFLPYPKTRSGVKKWIGYSESFAKGKLFINQGAVDALISDKAVSLLPVGVTRIEGVFRKGDLVMIYNEATELIGMGKAKYSSDRFESEKHAEKQKPIIHYDYLYLGNIRSNQN